MTFDADPLLEGIGKTLGPMIVVRPHMVGDRMVDGEVVWLTPVAASRFALRAGGLISEAYGPDIANMPATLAVESALRSPGVNVVLGPFQSDLLGETARYDVSAVTHLDLVVVKFLDRSEAHRERLLTEASQQQFRDMLDGLEAGVVLLTPHFEDDVITDAEIVWANAASHRLWTDQNGLLPGTRVTAVYFDQVEWLDAANRAWAGESVTRVLPAAPGTAIWTAATEVLSRVGDALLEFTHDRSKDQQLLGQLAEADHRFGALLDDLPLTVFVGEFGKDDLTFVSPNATKLLGLAPHRMRRISDLLALVHPDDRPSLDAMGDWIGGGRAEYASDWRIIRPDGRELIGAFQAVRRTGPTGVEGFIALVSDVTESRRLLEQMEAGERLQAMGRAAGSIAHDFNNLLMIVSGHLDRALQLAPQAVAPLTTAAKAAARASNLAQNMLAFARGRPGAPRQVHLHEFVTRFEPIIKGTLSPATTYLNCVPDDLPPVFADITHLEQVLLNLVTNARDAIQPNGTVTVSAALADTAVCHLPDDLIEAGPFVAIIVTDDGNGIPSSIQRRVWEPYFSSKQQTREHGTGLGLSTVHGIVHQYGGHVHLESAPGKGTRITCYLPVGQFFDPSI